MSDAHAAPAPDAAAANPEPAEEEDDDFAHDGVRMTRDVIVKSLSRADRQREDFDAHLRRLTHLRLDGKNIGRVDALATVPGVRVLYLYDNVISRLAGLDPLAPSLTHLYLQNNNLPRVEGLAKLAKLQKLYLDGNRITYVDGLGGCAELEELHLSAQRLDPEEELEFDAQTMASLARSLRVLVASRTRVRDPRPLRALASLRVLDLSHCQIEATRDLESVLLSAKKLTSLDARGNPGLSKGPKHRRDAKLTLLGQSLRLLNGREITPTEREFLVRMQTVRVQKRAAAAQRTQQQRQHLKTIASLGEGTVDHGFDGDAYSPTRGFSPTKSQGAGIFSPKDFPSSPNASSNDLILESTSSRRVSVASDRSPGGEKEEKDVGGGGEGAAAREGEDDDDVQIGAADAEEEEEETEEKTAAGEGEGEEDAAATAANDAEDEEEEEDPGPSGIDNGVQRKLDLDDDGEEEVEEEEEEAEAVGAAAAAADAAEPEGTPPAEVASPAPDPDPETPAAAAAEEEEDE